MATIEHNPDNLPSTKSSNWNPILDGDNYCSPACGCGCKLADYKAAVEAANLLANTLGEGWKPRVWENLGWHHEAIKGDITVIREQGNFVAKFQVNYVNENFELCIREVSLDPRCAIELLTTKLSVIVGKLTRTIASAGLDSVAIENV